MGKKERILGKLPWAVLLLAFAANLDNAVSGHLTALDTVLSIVYIGCWFWFLLRKGEGRPSRGLMIWSGLTLITAVLGLPVGVYGLHWDFVLPLALVFLTPFHGITEILPGNWWFFYILTGVVSFLWLMLGLYQRK